MYFHLRVHLISPRIAIPQDMHRRKDGGNSEKNPLESRKDCGSLRTPAHVASAEHEIGDKDGVCDEAGEPEEHGEGLDSQDGVGVGGFREEARRECQERDNEEGCPDSNEDQEVDAGRRVKDSKSVPP